jgi:hypothetical protein
MATRQGHPNLPEPHDRVIDSRHRQAFSTSP